MDTETRARTMPCEDGCRRWNTTSESQRMPKVTSCHQKLGPRRETLPLSLGESVALLTLFSQTFGLQKGERIILLFEAILFVVICYGHPRKPMPPTD